MTRFTWIAMAVCFGLGCGDKQNPAGDYRFDAAVPPSDATAGVSYGKTIAPMMAASCTLSGCHGGSSPVAGIGLDTYEGVRDNATAANAAIQSQAMPIGSGPALTAADRQSFQDWVSAGAPNN